MSNLIKRLRLYKASDCCDFRDIYQNALPVYLEIRKQGGFKDADPSLVKKYFSYANRFEKIEKCRKQSDIDSIRVDILSGAYGEEKTLPKMCFYALSKQDFMI